MERYGIDRQHDMTLEEVGKLHGGLSKERVRQLRNEAIGKLKHNKILEALHEEL